MFIQAAEHPSLRSRPERERLFQRCLDHIPDVETYISLWFHGATLDQLLRENVEDWILWAVFSADRFELQDHPEWSQELEGYVIACEKTMNLHFAEGRNPKVKSIRLTLDDVHIIHRPLVWYMVRAVIQRLREISWLMHLQIVALVDNLTSVAFWLLGFRHYAGPGWFAMFPFRPQTTLCSQSSEPLSYWMRPHSATDKHPIVFVHGLGVGVISVTFHLASLTCQQIGLFAYIRFFYMLTRTEPGVGIIAIELMPVSMRITAPILPRKQMVSAIHNILARHQFRKVVFMAHSYGSIVASHMLHCDSTTTNDTSSAPDENTPLVRSGGDISNTHSLIHSMLLIDPVAILLHLPTTANHFVYRIPREANEHQLWYFASRDAGIAHTLSRRFFWADNLLWKTDLTTDVLAGGAAVVISERDQITPAADIWTYLTGRSPREVGTESLDVVRWRSAPEETFDGKPLDLEVLLERGLDHAQVFDVESRLAQVVSILQRLATD